MNSSNVIRRIVFNLSKPKINIISYEYQYETRDFIRTNKQEGSLNEFIDKECKWFNYIKGNPITQTIDIKTEEFSFQGLGFAIFNGDDAGWTVNNIQ